MSVGSPLWEWIMIWKTKLFSISLKRKSKMKIKIRLPILMSKELIAFNKRILKKDTFFQMLLSSSSFSKAKGKSLKYLESLPDKNFKDKPYAKN